VVHRDLKLENILVDQELNIKIIDFGFAKNTQIDILNSGRGTKSYIAPEVREEKQYDGKKSDIFSLGVILFLLVQGNFPFITAEKKDKYYRKLMNGKLDLFFKKVGAQKLSTEFKDLIVKMLAYDPE